MSTRLSPAVQAALGQTRWTELAQYEATTSTNDVAVVAVRETGNPLLVVTAREQTEGRGRLGRRWVHTLDDGKRPESLAVTATLPAPHHAPLVPFAAGLAAYDAICAMGGSPALKWPNDVLLGGEKTAGILVERLTVANTDLVVIGTGFNVDWRGVTRDAGNPWTSVAEAVGASIDGDALLVQYLTALDMWLAKLDTPAQQIHLLDTYRTRCATIGSVVTVNLADGTTLNGTAEAISPRGELVLNQDGTLVLVTSGDVWHNLASQA